MITTGITEGEIKECEYILKDEYLHGVDSHRNDISFINIRERGFAEYAVILEPNMAEVVDGELGRNIWYTKSWTTENPVTVGGFGEVDSDKEITELAKKYIYDHRPTLYSRTCLGFNYDNEFDMIINDPNRMTGYLIIGKEKYEVEKYKMSVVIQNENKKLEFKLDENKYYQAYKRRNFFRELSNLCDKTVGFDERIKMIKAKLNEYDVLGDKFS